ncbi:thioesterase [Desulfosarcina widdelii]|uniref:Thioesterase n=1 Tax=Desulfosarcina widdelii TaxID=947919 RepID=A0A5K7YYM8_9BACT|nr:thioesterase family protein [Desulfosarcina widdelii]BBO74486.1 thioesterase [Desulfosarcina widdelii]
MGATEIMIRGYHMDVFGHVNNARYLEFLEEARWALFDHKMGLEVLAQEGFVLTVVNININFRQPAFLHDLLMVETNVKKWGSRSAILYQQVKNKKDEHVIADAEVTFVMVDVKTQKATMLEGGLKERLVSLMRD